MYPNNMAQVPPNYTAQPVAMPMYPVNPPYQPPIAYPQNNVMPGAGTPLLNNQVPNFNYSLEASECLEDLRVSSEAVVIKTVTGLIMKDTSYNISINGGGFQRNIFIAKKTNSSLTDRGGKSFSVNVKYIPRDVNFEDFVKIKDFTKRLFDITTVSSLLLANGNPTVNIINKENETLFGSFKKQNICCCSDPDFQLINNMNLLKYRINTEGCQCSYCCCDTCCCAKYETRYTIYNSNYQIVGDLLKEGMSDRPGEKVTYRIRFPLDATPEDKIVIISSAIIIDNFIHRSVGW